MQAPAPDSTSNKELGMVCMKMLGLALLAGAKGVSPIGPAAHAPLHYQRIAKADRDDNDGAMTSDELREYCLSFTGAEETFPFNPETSVFKVGGKMFALSRLGEESLRVSLKCEPRLAEALREAHAAVIPGYHLNKRHWNTVIFDGSLADGVVQEMIEDSYDLVVSKLSKQERVALGWSGDA